MDESLKARIAGKMKIGGVAGPAITAFLGAVAKVAAGETGQVSESAIDPAAELPRFETLPDAGTGDWLNQLVLVKLNGGLGTGMGLDRAKSLLPIKGQKNFLDFIARQVIAQRERAPNLAFYLMNSFSTQHDSLEYLERYSSLARDGQLDFLQSKVPKLDAKTLEPVSWPADPDLEWCPPGHGDLYPSLLGSGLLDRWLERGLKFLFVSNADNLGATVDLRLLSSFAQSGLSFLMEVTERTAADRKGGHLARRKSDGRLLLREAAQCPKADELAFQDIERHRYFNTNNLWIRLDHLRDELQRQGGALPLALITNHKTVDPRKSESPRVLQLESAMGSAIECFAASGAMVVPRTRFAPVKSTADLLALRSDAYVETDDFRLVLAPARRGRPPVIELDSHYKMLADFDNGFPDGAPSLVDCDSLKVSGSLKFSSGIVCRGQVEFTNPGSETLPVKPGVYGS
ncbi:MAG TPA: UTP--glucose-1-phosphate uridylyltransferase [Methylomirabilota bacterium]|nr:UTP--glucose-1-phosphate uridylyltransferase [Methylomirabilota bacterium]